MGAYIRVLLSFAADLEGGGYIRGGYTRGFTVFLSDGNNQIESFL